MKLFGSILHSTIWQQPDHVRLVWITMLALKDRDGVVEASVPGLAQAARQTIEATEEALAVLMGPDRYSRTPDHEGRRVAVVDGGWLILNHDKYRDKLDADHRREKAAERQRVSRDRRSGHTPSRSVTPVTLGHAESHEVRHADADADAYSGREPSPDQSGASGSGAIDRAERDQDQGGGDLPLPAQPPLPDIPRAVDASLEAELEASNKALRERQALRTEAWGRLEAARRTVARELGVEARPLHAHDPGERALALRIREAETIERAATDVDHVIAIAIAEARASGSVQWLTGVVFEERSWRRALGMTPSDAMREAARKLAGPRGTKPEEAPRKIKPL